jgi:serine/threonine protein kinase
MELSQIKSIMHQLLLAVSHCHDSGVVHRDLKPGSIFISFA